MSRLIRLRPAGLLAASISLVAVACGTDTLDLLPRGALAGMAGAGSGGQPLAGTGGVEITAGNAGAASGSQSGMGGLLNGGAGDGGNGGSFQNGGKGGGYGCVGFTCGGSNAGGGGGSGGTDPRCPEPGSPWCTPCNDSDDCPPQFSCSSFSYCRPTCTSSWECPKDGVCDETYGTCGPCFSDPQCAAEGIPKRNACEIVLGRCVECNERVDCMRGNCVSLQCVICDDDKDCMGGKRCDRGLGKCL